MKWTHLTGIDRKALGKIAIASLVVGGIVLQSVYFSVVSGHAAVVTRFGRPVREISEAGPYGKWPWPVDQVYDIDQRWRLFHTPFTATLTRDKKSVVLLTYVVWRVQHPLLFLQSVGSMADGDRKLDGMVTAAKNFRTGQYDLTALVSTNEEEIKTGEIEAKILGDVEDKAREKFGIEVREIGFKRIAFPEENSPAVLAHMRSERTVEANRLRAEGAKDAQAIRNDVMVRTEGILKEGRERAGKIRGEAEMAAAAIYAKAHGRDPEFYRFWRSLEAAKKALGGGKATLVLSTDEGLFHVLMDPAKSSHAGKSGK